MLFNLLVMSKFLRPHGPQHARLPCPSPSPGACSNSNPLSQWCHPTVSSCIAPSSPALNLSQHQGLFQWDGSSHQVAKVLKLQPQSFQWIFWIDFRWYWLVGSPCRQGTPTSQSKSINSVVFSLIYGPTCMILEKAMAPHSSTLAWKIPWMEKPGRLQSLGSLRVGSDWATSLSLFTFMHWRRKWQPTSVFLPGESQGQGAWWAAVYVVAQSRTWLKWLSMYDLYPYMSTGKTIALTKRTFIGKVMSLL